MLLAVYGERALVDYDFQSFFIVSVGADFLVIGKVVVMIQVMLKGEFLKPKNVTSLSVRGEYDFVWCCC
jgi:hypothetical protein